MTETDPEIEALTGASRVDGSFTVARMSRCSVPDFHQHKTGAHAGTWYYWYYLYRSTAGHGRGEKTRAQQHASQTIKYWDERARSRLRSITSAARLRRRARALSTAPRGLRRRARAPSPAPRGRL